MKYKNEELLYKIFSGYEVLKIYECSNEHKYRRVLYRNVASGEVEISSISRFMTTFNPENKQSSRNTDQLQLTPEQIEIRTESLNKKYNEGYLNPQNKSGINGVSFDKKSKKWKVDIGIKGKHYQLGVYYLLKNAAEARKIAQNKGIEYYKKIKQALYIKDEKEYLKETND